MSITATLGDIRGSRRCFGDHGLLFPDTRFTAVTHRFRDALSFGKVYPPIWLRQSGTTHLPDISISSPKIPV